MKKVAGLLVCLCLAWLIHFQQMAPSVIRSPLKVDKIERDGIKGDEYRGSREYIKAEKNGKIVIIPWSNILYIEEVN